MSSPSTRSAISPLAVSTITGRVGFDPSDRGQHLDPVASRQHPVEDHEVDVAAERQPLALDPVAGRDHVVALRLEAALEEVGDRSLVLDDQDLHVPMLVRNASRRPSSASWTWSGLQALPRAQRRAGWSTWESVLIR